ncbi:hypothetical protein CNBG_4818 [Cryptococcus deuterogattii R265]|uniref:Protein transport protein YOS1 n=2 Tax=Cryptococcus gattii species complex TaxID=1884637 RepID=A0ABZ2B182_9TREE|nr:hypothetical protein D1P53_000882 [Cryptococcus gattii VGV]KGB78980.2 hypothetical protein CNBG_4818 [Cryptococcus deuterogattii R265]
MVFGYFGSLFYIGLLFTNAIAILNEERFLARIGWSTRVPSTANAGFGHSPAPQMFDTAGFGGASGSEGAGVKAKLVNLIGATRTLMRIPLIVVNIGVIIYEVLLG